jgi:formylglycine-generating enzyme required for sulfatase activity/predicted esterase
LGHYELRELLGAGGMGEVYRAADTKLGRDVALKVLPAALGRDADRLARFQREAKALAALDHPGIVTVYSVEQAEATSAPGDGVVHFITMQLIEGRSLDRLLPEHGFPIERFLEIGVALSDALAAAHEKGIVHRDLKLANVMATSDGHVKILDFGIAKGMEGTDPAEATRTFSGATAIGQVMGTPSYMSPEQIEGRAVHSASDIFSLGIVLYEMATGRRPFRGESEAGLLSSILRDTPARPSEIRTGLPKSIDALIESCLEKDSARRPSAREVGQTLRRLQPEVNPAVATGLKRPGVLAAVAVVVIAVVGVAAWAGISRSRRAVFLAESLPRIESLAREGRHLEAFQLAKAVEQSSGPAAVSEELWELVSARVPVVSEPAGATVTIRPFGGAAENVALGLTPIASARVPRGAFHWRVELAGHIPADLVTGTPSGPLRFDLRADGVPERDMIRIPGGEVRLWALGAVRPQPAVTLGAFLIDRYEVTNRQFAEFVRAGGYTREDFWKHRFVDNGRTMPFQEAMERFRDSTGRPGPATWRVGSYADGEEDMPVTGISWFEAAAYAAFAGKELPTVYHWYQADTANDIQMLPGLVLSGTNHESPGPRPSGKSGAMSAYGAIDMAGNVREWSINTSDSGRLALGGAWSDPAYLYLFPEARSAFDRAAGNGMRCIKRLEPDPAPELSGGPLPPRPVIDRAAQAPVSEAEFAVFTRFFERRSVPPDVKIESTDESSPHWIKQRISFAAGYGNERMSAWLYLPRNARAPFQVVIQMAGAATFYRKSSATEKDIFGWAYAEYLLRGGRAVLIPIWKGSYERSDGFHPLQTEWPSYRDHVIQWVSEVRRSVDYLQSRDDINADAIAYQGISNGAIWAPMFLALEPRIKTALVLLGGALVTPIHETPMPPEIDAYNYAPQVTQPVLMINGRHDAIFPYETAQRPLFDRLGTAKDRKEHKTFPGGHSSSMFTNELITEGLNWLDRWLGPPAR